MTSEFYRRVEHTLQAVEDLDEGERKTVLARMRTRALEDPETDRDAVEAIDTVERWFALKPPVALGSQEVLADLLEPGEDPETVGPYEILRRLGDGPLAVTYEALDPERERAVAVKLLRPGLPNDEFHEVFRYALPALLVFRHPNLVRFLDVGRTDEGRTYLVQELVEGPGLERSCRQRRATLADRLELVAQVCDGLAEAHRRGHLHLGISARKVRVVSCQESRRPLARVLDLGIVPALSRGRVCVALGGSPAPWAVSPEQVGFGNGALDLDLRADVYGTGAILYRLLTGRPPGDSGSDAAAIGDAGARDERPNRRRLRRLLSEPIPPSQVYQEAVASEQATDLPLPADGATIRVLERQVDPVVLRALALDRDERHESMSALAADLRGVRTSGSAFSVFQRPDGWMPRRLRDLFAGQ